MAEITREACKAAKKQGLTVSCDLNFRAKLWPKEKAREVMTGLMEYVDILFTNEEEAEKVFGIAARESDVKSAKLDKQGYEDVASQLCNNFSLKYVSISLRSSKSATVNDWAGMLFGGEKGIYKPQLPHRLYC